MAQPRSARVRGRCTAAHAPGRARDPKVAGAAGGEVVRGQLYTAMDSDGSFCFCDDVSGKSKLGCTWTVGFVHARERTVDKYERRGPIPARELSAGFVT